MENISIDDVRELVNRMCDTVDLIAEKFDQLPDGTGDAVRMEIAMFMMYLSASDGIIQWDEAKAIGEICGLGSLTPSKLGGFIRDNKIYTTEFENKVPLSLTIMVKVDNVLSENEDFDTDASASAALISTYKTVGQALILSDGDADENEINDYNIYIGMMEKYREENYVGAQNSASGFSKNGVVAPNKGGVIAPKKG